MKTNLLELDISEHHASVTASVDFLRMGISADTHKSLDTNKTTDSSVRVLCTGENKS